MQDCDLGTRLTQRFPIKYFRTSSDEAQSEHSGCCRVWTHPKENLCLSRKSLRFAVLVVVLKSQFDPFCELFSVPINSHTKRAFSNCCWENKEWRFALGKLAAGGLWKKGGKKHFSPQHPALENNLAKLKHLGTPGNIKLLFKHVEYLSMEQGFNKCKTSRKAPVTP